MDEKQTKRNLINYPLGTVGRDMIYALFTNFLLLFIMYTRNLTNAQLGVVTAIMVAARIFDAFNDPIMGNIIERTRSKYGKYKPWLLIGVIGTCIVVTAMFNTSLDGWNFIIFFGIMYFLFSITYTMNDISYWGMVPALSSDGEMRDKFTARTTLFAGIGNVLASVAIPVLTTGAYALGGSAKTAYGRIALIICIITPIFICFTLFGVKENRDDMKTQAPPVSIKKIWTTITGNDQLLWMCLVFLLQETGNGIVLTGLGSNYIYFEFGYEGGLYSTFTTIGMMATAILMIFYPAISKKLHRNKMVLYIGIIGTIGYVIQLGCGLLMEATMTKFWIFTIGFMLANFGQYGLYLIMMISIINTVEYNEWKHGQRDEAIITSMRPFLSKFASAVSVLIASLSYMIFKVTDFTNQISTYENQAERGVITSEERSGLIAQVIANVTDTQRVGLLIFMTVVPCLMMIVCCALYRKFYILDEEKYEKICEELGK